MKRYMKSLEEQASYTTTQNGAKTHSTSGDACLDFFAVAGGMRYRKKADQILLFDRAYLENPELAMKLLFHIRDIRGGMGEREMFRTLLRHVAFTWPASVKKNVAYIPDFGRYDDLLCLFGTPEQDDAVALIREQLNKDKQALEKRRNGCLDARISLLAKWLPSGNASSHKTRKKAKMVMRALGMDAESYRRTLTALRSNIGLTERYLTKGQPEKVVYSSVPAGAMLKYRAAFARKDEVRFRAYLEKAELGEEKINCKTLFPYEITRPFFKGQELMRILEWSLQHVGNKGLSESDLLTLVPHDQVEALAEEALDVLWDCAGNGVHQNNAISIVDTSGSMFYFRGTGNKALVPALFAESLGLYLAEHCTGPFHNKIITFESTPHLIKIHGSTLREKLIYLNAFSCGGTTNLEAVFQLILKAAVESGADQEELPQTIYIFSDMEFDVAFPDMDKTVFESAKIMFEKFGYRLPAVVFHNVDSWRMQVPVRKDSRGAALVSGQSTSAFRYPTDVNMTPMSHMLEILNSRRYRMIHA